MFSYASHPRLICDSFVRGTLRVFLIKWEIMLYIYDEKSRVVN